MFQKTFCILSFILCLSFIGKGQNTPEQVIDSLENLVQKKSLDSQSFLIEKASIDSSKIEVRAFDKATLASYKEKDEFQYNRIAPRRTSFWDEFLRWLSRTLFRTEFSETTDATIKYAIYVIVALVTLWAIFKISQTDIFSIFFLQSSKKSATPQGEWLQDTIHGVDFDKQIKEAVAQKNYRIAVRLFYLYTLKKLSDKELIAWEINKTNHDYTDELQKTTKGSLLKEDFEKATYYFEYVWYGDFKVNDLQFEQAKALYEQFIKRI